MHAWCINHNNYNIHIIIAHHLKFSHYKHLLTMFLSLRNLIVLASCIVRLQDTSIQLPQNCIYNYIYIQWNLPPPTIEDNLSIKDTSYGKDWNHYQKNNRPQVDLFDYGQRTPTLIFFAQYGRGRLLMLLLIILSYCHFWHTAISGYCKKTLYIYIDFSNLILALVHVFRQYMNIIIII